MRSDAELIAASGHSPESFRELYDRYADQVHGFMLKRSGNRDAALDLTAETFAQAWGSRHRFEDRVDGSAGPWLFGIARNVLSRSARERRLIRESSDALRLERGGSELMPDDSWVDGIDADLERALLALPESQRRAVQLRIIADQSYADVSDALNCSPAAARIRVSRGLASLRSHYEPIQQVKEST